jgi:hypothetical protein
MLKVAGVDVQETYNELITIVFSYLQHDRLNCVFGVGK